MASEPSPERQQPERPSRCNRLNNQSCSRSHKQQVHSRSGLVHSSFDALCGSN